MALAGGCASEASVLTALEQLLAVITSKVLRGLHLVAPVGRVVSRVVCLPNLLAVIAPRRDLSRKRLLAAGS